MPIKTRTMRERVESLDANTYYIPDLIPEGNTINEITQDALCATDVKCIDHARVLGEPSSLRCAASALSGSLEFAPERVNSESRLLSGDSA